MLQVPNPSSKKTKQKKSKSSAEDVENVKQKKGKMIVSDVRTYLFISFISNYKHLIPILPGTMAEEFGLPKLYRPHQINLAWKPEAVKLRRSLKCSSTQK